MASQYFLKENQKEKYPWTEMDIKDWFIAKLGNITSATYQANRRFGTKCFAAHKQRDGSYRVERIA